MQSQPGKLALDVGIDFYRNLCFCLCLQVFMCMVLVLVGLTQVSDTQAVHTLIT